MVAGNSLPTEALRTDQLYSRSTKQAQSGLPSGPTGRRPARGGAARLSANRRPPTAISAVII